MQKKQSNSEVAKVAAEQIMDMFKRKDFGEQLTWSIIQRRKSDDKPCLHWSLSNYMLMVFVGKTLDARTFLQFKEIGRSVRKGARAFQLIAPLVVKKENPDTKDLESKLVGFKAFNVFRIQDTVVVDEAKAAAATCDYTPEHIKELSRKIIKALQDKWQVTVEYGPVQRAGVLGYFSPSTNSIYLSEQGSDGVLAHEATHFLHSLEENINEADNARCELIAELGAMVIMQAGGSTDTKGYAEQAWKYLSSYVGENPSDKEVLSKLTSVLNVVEKCVCRLLDAIDEVVGEE